MVSAAEPAGLSGSGFGIAAIITAAAGAIAALGGACAAVLRALSDYQERRWHYRQNPAAARAPAAPAPAPTYLDDPDRRTDGPHHGP